MGHLKQLNPSLLFSRIVLSSLLQIQLVQSDSLFLKDPVSQPARVARSEASPSSSLQREQPNRRSNQAKQQPTDRKWSNDNKKGKRTTLTSTNDAVSRRGTDLHRHHTLNCLTQLCSTSLCSAVPTTVSAVIGNEERGSEGPCGPHAVTAGSRLLQAERSGRNSAFRCVSGLSGPWPSQSVPPMSGDTLIFAHILCGRLVEVVGRELAIISMQCCSKSRWANLVPIRRSSCVPVMNAEGSEKSKLR